LGTEKISQGPKVVIGQSRKNISIKKPTSSTKMKKYVKAKRKNIFECPSPFSSKKPKSKTS
jgi:hypothetical protein